MKLFGILFLCLFVRAAPPEDSLRVLFWNLENFFDWRCDSTGVSDAEFSSRGARHWTRKRFRAKCNAVAKGILWAGSTQGGLPDAVGLAEIENRFVLRRLVQETILRKLDYEVVHFDSPDPRGIDVALLYRRSRLRLIQARPRHLYQSDTLLRTRDILVAHFTDPSGADLALLVNHHPSKYGGAAVSEPRRQVAVQRMKSLSDSLKRLGINRIIAIGDFNDTPENPVYRQLDSSFLNLAAEPARKGLGSIKYDGAWELIDLVFATPESRPAPMRILQIPFLMTWDTAHSGWKPLRTYSGPRYLGGVSDHCPVWVALPVGQ